MSPPSDFKLVRQGAEAKLYVGTFLGRPTLIKERFPKKYRIPELDERLTKDRIKAECRALVKCKSLGIITPTVYFVDTSSGSIYMEHLEDWSTVRDFLASSPSMEKQLAVARSVGVVLSRMHSAHLVHGDPTTSNIMLKATREEASPYEVQVALLDFGLSSGEARAEDKAVDLYVLERALLSTHAGSQEVFEAILEAYAKEMGAKLSKEVLLKLEEVQARGRKRLMIG